MVKLLTPEDYHPSWESIFDDNRTLINQILANVKEDEIAPARSNIFRAFQIPIEEVRVVIFGQDPYPGDGVADGLAFSSSGSKIPPSLRNIFREYADDLNLAIPVNPSLQKWSEQGVMLLNRTLTTQIGERNAHLASEWKSFTFQVAEILARRDVIAILWGRYARELSPLFRRKIESVHPSPLSARNGFFGSRPFSTINSLLKDGGLSEIDWVL